MALTSKSSNCHPLSAICDNVDRTQAPPPDLDEIRNAVREQLQAQAGRLESEQACDVWVVISSVESVTM